MISPFQPLARSSPGIMHYDSIQNCPHNNFTSTIHLASLDYDISIFSSSIWNKNSNDLIVWICNETWVGSVCCNSPSPTSLYFAIQSCTATVVNPIQRKLLAALVDDPRGDLWWTTNRLENRTIGNRNCNRIQNTLCKINSTTPTRIMHYAGPYRASFCINYLVGL